MAEYEDRFKQEIYPAPWVMPEQADMAKYEYKSYLEKYKKIQRCEKQSLPNIVPYNVRMKGIEKLVTDPAFKSFWEKAGEYWVINTIGGLYLHYIGPDDQNMRPLLTAISKTERDKRLDEAADLLKSFCLRVSSDPSVETCFQVAFYDALKAGPFECVNPHSISAFLNKLYESLTDKGSDGCRRMKTHDSYPRNVGQGDLAERGRSCPLLLIWSCIYMAVIITH